MPLETRMMRVPGVGLTARAATRIASTLAVADNWFLYGMICPFGVPGIDGHAPIARNGLSWPAGGIFLRDRHNGEIIGSSCELWDTADGLLGVFELNDDPRVRNAVMAAVQSGAAFSAGFGVDGTTTAGEVTGTIVEASITPYPAMPDSVIAGLYTPPLIYHLTAEGWIRSHGPRFGEYSTDQQLLDQLAAAPDDAARLALLNALPDAGPSHALVTEARSEYAAATAPHDTRGGVETVTSSAEVLELRSAGGRNYLDCRCVPYDEITERAHGARRERFLRGAFADVDPAKVKLTDENHTTGRRPVGFAVHLEERSDGLYGSFRFANTPEGRGAYENVVEGTYGGVSVGFVARDAPTVAGIREIRRARLHHVSLVDEPAYAGAKIIAVREAN